MQTSPLSFENTGRRNRVLVVDDMATNRELVKAMLDSDVYAVFEAADGSEALAYLREHEVDVVLLDINMPGLSGFQVCKAIRNDLGLDLLPILMLTALDSSDDLVLAMGCGANDYIRKPVQNVELIARINAAIKQKRLTDQLDDAESLLFTLARLVEAKDKSTGDHCDRLAHMGAVFGERLNLSEDQINSLRRAGVLHDIGKLAVPESVLCKKGPLTDEEWEVMRQHPAIGASLCGGLRTMQSTVEIIQCHHERWNGSGYPNGFAGEEIPLLARVFQIIDAFDALSFKRSYKDAFSQEKVASILREETRLGLWDPELMASFLNFLESEPERLQYELPPNISRSQKVMQEILRSGVMIDGV